MKGRRALDPEESAFSKLIASVLKEVSPEIPRAQQGNAPENRSAFPEGSHCKHRVILYSDVGRWKWRSETADVRRPRSAGVRTAAGGSSFNDQKRQGTMAMLCSSASGVESEFERRQRRGPDRRQVRNHGEKERQERARTLQLRHRHRARPSSHVWNPR